MSILFDVILVILFVFFIWRGWRHGAMATLLRVLGWVVAAALIAGFSANWAQRIYDNTVEPTVVSAVESVIPEDAVTAMNSGADTIEEIQSVLNGLSGLLGGQSVDSSGVDSILSLFQQDGAGLAQAITDTVLEPVLLIVVQAVLSLIILVVVLFIFRILSRMSMRRTRRRNGVLTTTNQLLGGVLGILQGLAVDYLYVYVLTILASFLVTDWISPTILDSTLLVKIFM